MLSVYRRTFPDTLSFIIYKFVGEWLPHAISSDLIFIAVIIFWGNPRGYPRGRAIHGYRSFSAGRRIGPGLRPAVPIPFPASAPGP